MVKKIRIGIIARVDYGGLAMMSYDFWKNIPEITRELSILSNRTEEDDITRYPKAIICNGYPTLSAINEFLKNIDIVLAFETFYNWRILTMARERGIKTILIPMYEWTKENLIEEPDMFLCPSRIDYDIYKKEAKTAMVEYLPVPVDRNVFKFRLRKKAKTFVFNNGHGGAKGRNGLIELLQAISHIQSKDIKIIINSQVIVPHINDKRVEIRIGNSKREDLFKEGDVFIFPHKFNGLSLPIQEALSCGMPVISTDIYPHNTYLPREWLFKPEGFYTEQMTPETREIEVAQINPKAIAKKIDEFANTDITSNSKKADKIADSISWFKMYPKYIKTFNKLL